MSDDGRLSNLENQLWGYESMIAIKKEHRVRIFEALHTNDIEITELTRYRDKLLEKLAHLKS